MSGRSTDRHKTARKFASGNEKRKLKKIKEQKVSNLLAGSRRITDFVVTEEPEAPPEVSLPDIDENTDETEEPSPKRMRVEEDVAEPVENPGEPAQEPVRKINFINCLFIQISPNIDILVYIGL